MTNYRVQGWEELLGEYIKRHLQQPFAWGDNDCGVFAAGAVKVLTGRDILAELNQPYDTPQKAFKIIRKRFGDLQALGTHFLGQPVLPLKAKRGDIMLGPFFNGPREMLSPLDTETFGVCCGRKCATVGDDELVYWPISKARIAWHV